MDLSGKEGGEKAKGEEKGGRVAYREENQREIKGDRTNGRRKEL